MNVVIIGAGYMGSALAWPLRDKGHAVNLVGTHLDEGIIEACERTGVHPKLKRKLPNGVRVFSISKLEDAMEEAEIVVSGVNSFGVSWITDVLRNCIRSGQVVLSVTKGLDIRTDGTVRTFPQVIEEAFPPSLRSKVPVAAIGGPCIAGELAGRRQSCVVFGADKISTAEFLASIFRTSYYHVWPTSELFSLEVAVALKNLFALAVGVAYGILEKAGGPDEAEASMHNLSSALFAEGTVEIHKALELLGGRPEFAYSLPGVGDLYVTSTGGRSVRMGMLLGSGLSFKKAEARLQGETLEAVEIIRSMSRWIVAQDKKQSIGTQDFPLMRALIDVVVKGAPLKIEPEGWFSQCYN